MKQIIEFIFWSIFVLIIFLGGIYVGRTSKNIKDDFNFIKYDTIYNKVILDSIEYKIYQKDSIIIKLKTKFEYEKEKIINANDSDTVEQFKQLAGSE